MEWNAIFINFQYFGYKDPKLEVLVNLNLEYDRVKPFSKLGS